MEPDVYGSSSTTRTPPIGSAGTMTPERQFTDYIADIGDTVSSGAWQVLDFVSERPLVVGSVAAGAIGAVAGNRLAHMVAMRRRRTLYDRLLETAGIALATVGTTVSGWSTGKAMDRLTEARKSMSGPAQNLRKSVRESNLPTVARPRGERPGVIRQIGYGVSLIPLTLALLRNPLIRSIGLRALSRRARRRR